jgi:hypothetical protein
VAAVRVKAMRSPDHLTAPAIPAPSVLAVSCPPGLVSRCAGALLSIGIGLRECGFVNAATVVAERRPLVILIVKDIYSFDPDAFDALARDVQASLVRVDEDIPAATLELLLATAIDDAAARRSEALPAWPTSNEHSANGRRTVPHPGLIGYTIGQRLLSPGDVGGPPPSSRPGTL